MPNHITNRLKFVGDKSRISELRSYIRTEGESERLIDFNKIIPMPKELEGMVSDGHLMALENQFCHDTLKEVAANLRKSAEVQGESFNETLENFLRGIRNYVKFGHATWYNWSVKNWGTKWNSYDNVERDGYLFFDTAWSSPIVVLEKLSEMFPDVEIQLTYADEDSGSNVGVVSFNGGRAIARDIINQSKEAYEVYFELNPDRREDFELVGGKYTYKDEE